MAEDREDRGPGDTEEEQFEVLDEVGEVEGWDSDFFPDCDDEEQGVEDDDKQDSKVLNNDSVIADKENKEHSEKSSKEPSPNKEEKSSISSVGKGSKSPVTNAVTSEHPTNENVKLEDSSVNKDVKAKESTVSKDVKSKESSVSKDEPTANKVVKSEPSAGKDLKSKDSSVSKDVKSELSASKDVKSESARKDVKSESSTSKDKSDSSAAIDVKSNDSSASKDVKSKDSSTSKDVKPKESIASKDVKSESTSSKDVKSKDSSASKDVKSKDSSASKDVKLKDSSASKDVKLKDSSASKDVKSKDSSTSKDVKSKDSSTSKDVKSKDSSISKDVKSKDSSSSKDVKSKDSSSSKDVKSKDSSTSKDVKSKDPTANKDVKSKETSASKDSTSKEKTLESSSSKNVKSSTQSSGKDANHKDKDVSSSSDKRKVDKPMEDKKKESKGSDSPQKTVVSATKRKSDDVADQKSNDKKIKLSSGKTDNKIQASNVVHKASAEELRREFLINRKRFVTSMITLSEELKRARDYRRWAEKHSKDGMLFPVFDITQPSEPVLFTRCHLISGYEHDSTKLCFGFPRNLEVLRFNACEDRYTSTVRSLVKGFEEMVQSSGKPLFDPIAQQGYWHGVSVDTNINGKAILLVNVFIADGREEETLFSEAKNILLKHFNQKSHTNSQVSSIYLKLVSGKKDQATEKVGPERSSRCIMGCGFITETIKGLKIRLYPRSSFSTGSFAMAALCEELLKVVLQECCETVVELGCCTGVVGQVLSKHCTTVIGVDTAENIADAKVNAEENKLINCKYLDSNSKDVWQDLGEMLRGRPAALVIVNALNMDFLVKDPAVLDFLQRSEEVHKVAYVKSLEIFSENILGFLCLPIKAVRRRAEDRLPYLPLYASALDLGTEMFAAIIVFQHVKKDFVKELFADREKYWVKCVDIAHFKQSLFEEARCAKEESNSSFVKLPTIETNLLEGKLNEQNSVKVSRSRSRSRSPIKNDKVGDDVQNREYRMIVDSSSVLKEENIKGNVDINRKDDIRRSSSQPHEDGAARKIGRSSHVLQKVRKKDDDMPGMQGSEMGLYKPHRLQMDDSRSLLHNLSGFLHPYSWQDPSVWIPYREWHHFTSKFPGNWICVELLQHVLTDDIRAKMLVRNIIYDDRNLKFVVRKFAGDVVPPGTEDSKPVKYVNNNIASYKNVNGENALSKSSSNEAGTASFEAATVVDGKTTGVARDKTGSVVSGKTTTVVSSETGGVVSCETAEVVQDEANKAVHKQAEEVCGEATKVISGEVNEVTSDDVIDLTRVEEDERTEVTSSKTVDDIRGEVDRDVRSKTSGVVQGKKDEVIRSKGGRIRNRSRRKNREAYEDVGWEIHRNRMRSPTDVESWLDARYLWRMRGDMYGPYGVYEDRRRFLRDSREVFQFLEDFDYRAGSEMIRDEEMRERFEEWQRMRYADIDTLGPLSIRSYDDSELVRWARSRRDNSVSRIETDVHGVNINSSRGKLTKAKVAENIGGNKKKLKVQDSKVQNVYHISVLDSRRTVRNVKSTKSVHKSTPARGAEVNNLQINCSTQQNTCVTYEIANTTQNEGTSFIPSSVETFGLQNSAQVWSNQTNQGRPGDAYFFQDPYCQNPVTLSQSVGMQQPHQQTPLALHQLSHADAFMSGVPPAQFNAVVPPPQINTALPPPQVHTVMPPPQFNVAVPPPQFNMVVPPPQIHAVMPPPQVQTIVPPPQVRTTIPGSSPDTGNAPRVAQSNSVSSHPLQWAGSVGQDAQGLQRDTRHVTFEQNRNMTSQHLVPKEGPAWPRQAHMNNSLSSNQQTFERDSFFRDNPPPRPVHVNSDSFFRDNSPPVPDNVKRDSFLRVNPPPVHSHIQREDSSHCNLPSVQDHVYGKAIFRDSPPPVPNIIKRDSFYRDNPPPVKDRVQRDSFFRNNSQPLQQVRVHQDSFFRDNSSPVQDHVERGSFRDDSPPSRVRNCQPLQTHVETDYFQDNSPRKSFFQDNSSPPQVNVERDSFFGDDSPPLRDHVESVSFFRRDSPPVQDHVDRDSFFRDNSSHMRANVKRGAFFRDNSSPVRDYSERDAFRLDNSASSQDNVVRESVFQSNPLPVQERDHVERDSFSRNIPSPLQEHVSRNTFFRDNSPPLRGQVKRVSFFQNDPSSAEDYIVRGSIFGNKSHPLQDHGKRISFQDNPSSTRGYVPRDSVFQIGCLSLQSNVKRVSFSQHSPSPTHEHMERDSFVEHSPSPAHDHVQSVSFFRRSPSPAPQDRVQRVSFFGRSPSPVRDHVQSVSFFRRSPSPAQDHVQSVSRNNLSPKQDHLSRDDSYSADDFFSVRYSYGHKSRQFH